MWLPRSEAPPCACDMRDGCQRNAPMHWPQAPAPLATPGRRSPCASVGHPNAWWASAAHHSPHQPLGACACMKSLVAVEVVGQMGCSDNNCYCLVCWKEFSSVVGLYFHCPHLGPPMLSRILVDFARCNNLFRSSQRCPCNSLGCAFHSMAFEHLSGGITQHSPGACKVPCCNN